MSSSPSAFEQTLAKFEPEGFAGPDSNLQERRSAETRTLILESAIRCLAENGYAKTSTLQVSSMARASRGAMLHHYPTKRALIEATVEYAFYKRLRSLFESIQGLSEEERVNRNLGPRMEFQNFQSNEYKAYLELNIAARTDPELREFFLPLARKYDRVWRDEILKIFPEWQGSGELFDRASELTRATLEGLLLNRDIWNDPKAEEEVIEILSTLLSSLRQKAMAIKQDNDAA